MHSNPDQAKVADVFHQMGEGHAQKLLSDVGLTKESGFGATIHPALTKELTEGFKGGTAPTPLADALHNSTFDDQSPLIDAAIKHLGPDALGVKQATSFKPADVAHALSKHAAGNSDSSVAPDAFVTSHENALTMYGTEGHHTSLAKAYAAGKTANAIKSLNLGGEEGPKLQAKIHSVLAPKLTSDYKAALDTNNPHPGGLAGQIDRIAADTNAKGAALAQQNGWPEDSPAIKTWKSNYFANKVQDVVSATPQAGAGGTSTHTAPAASVPAINPVSTGTSHADISAFTDQIKNHLFSAYKSAHKGTVLSAPIQDQYDNLVAVAHHYAGENIGFSPEIGKSSKIPHDLSVAQVAKVVDESIAAHLGKPNQNVLENKILSWLQTPEGTAYAKNHTVDKSLANALASSTQTAKDIKLAPGEKVQKLAGPGKYQASKTVFDFKPLTAEEMQKSQDDYLKATGTEWNHDQVAALANYTTGAYYEVNSYLRGEDHNGKPVTDVATLTKDRIKVMQSAMRPLRQDTLLKRGTGLEQFPPHMRSFDGLKAAIGKTFKEPAFMSTTVGGEGGNFHDTAMLQIEAPAGTPAAWVRHISHNAHENEVVLAAGSHFRITHVEKDLSGNIRVHVRVVS